MQGRFGGRTARGHTGWSHGWSCLPSARSARSKVGESAPVVSVTRKPVGSPGDRGAGRRRSQVACHSRTEPGHTRDTRTRAADYWSTAAHHCAWPTSSSGWWPAAFAGREAGLRAKRRRCARSIFKKCSTFHPFLKMLRGGFSPSRTVYRPVIYKYFKNSAQYRLPRVSFYWNSYDTDEKW